MNPPNRLPQAFNPARATPLTFNAAAAPKTTTTTSVYRLSSTPEPAGPARVSSGAAQDSQAISRGAAAPHQTRTGTNR